MRSSYELIWKNESGVQYTRSFSRQQLDCAIEAFARVTRCKNTTHCALKSRGKVIATYFGAVDANV